MLSKVEYVQPKTIITPMLKLYGLLLSIKRSYIDIVTLKDKTISTRCFVCTPVLLIIMYYLKISDTFVLWMTLNYLILRKHIKLYLAQKPSELSDAKPGSIFSVASQMLSKFTKTKGIP